MPEDLFGLRRMSDKELYGWIADWKPSTEKYIAGMQELRRRSEAPINIRAWVAIGISLLSLIIAAIALFK